MYRTSVVVIGAGQAGLAVSHLLGTAQVDHVVLERDRTAARWAGHSWQSLRLLTPNWMSRLPGHSYRGPDPAGFMPAAEVAGYLRTYAARSAAPVHEGVDVLSVRRCDDGYRVVTSDGTWTAVSVVVATGWCDVPQVPALASGLDRRIAQFTPATYRDPGSLPDGGVLVVGASATGVQLADELAADGRRVVLAVGSHSRVPRAYRGMDICWWLDAMGTFSRNLADYPNPAAARREPSLQLVGGRPTREVDLPSLQRRGVQLAGRLTGIDGPRVQLADDLAVSTHAADARLHGLLRRIDAFALRTGIAAELDPAATIRKARLSGRPDQLDLVRSQVRSVVWATGYRRSYSWLQVPVLDREGNIEHVDGATAAPGLHVVGMRWQTRRDSSFLDGVGRDAAIVVDRVLADLGVPPVGVGRAA